MKCLALLPILSIAASSSPTAALADQTIPINVSLKVGTTKRLWIVSAHRSDCSSDDGRSVEVVTAPALGRISQREGVPSIVEHSLSGTCMGAHVTGVGVDYTAAQTGTDRFGFDGVFANGRVHYLVTARNR